MRLCRKCAGPVAPTTVFCPRCGKRLPWWGTRSRRPAGPRLVPGVTSGKDCPSCGRRTFREHAPLWFRPLRLLLGTRCSYRSCAHCRWHGAAFHAGPASTAQPPAE